MAIVMKTTSFWFETGMRFPNLNPFNPSIAVVTVTAGVNVPSARIAAPPINAGMISHFARFLTNA